MHESLNNEPAQAENVEIRDRRSGEGVAERPPAGEPHGRPTPALRAARGGRPGRSPSRGGCGAGSDPSCRCAPASTGPRTRHRPRIRPRGFHAARTHPLRPPKRRASKPRRQRTATATFASESVFRSAKIRFFSRRYALHAGKIRTAETAFPVQRHIRPVRAAAKARKNVPAAAVAAGTEASFPSVAENVSGASEAGPAAATPRTGRGGSRRSCSSLRA